MKHIKTTPWNLMRHEFNQTLRILSKTNSFQELLRDITFQKNKNSQQLGKCIGVAALFLVILISNENQNAISISILNVSIVIKNFI